MSVRIASQVSQWMEEALSTKTEDIDFDVTVAISPQGPVLALVMYMKGAVLGTTLNSHLILENPAGVTKEMIESVCSQVCEGLAIQRSKQLAETNGHSGLV